MRRSQKSPYLAICRVFEMRKVQGLSQTMASSRATSKEMLPTSRSARSMSVSLAKQGQLDQLLDQGSLNLSNPHLLRSLAIKSEMPSVRPLTMSNSMYQNRTRNKKSKNSCQIRDLRSLPSPQYPSLALQLSLLVKRRPLVTMASIRTKESNMV